MINTDAAIQYAQSHQKEFMEELKELLRIPSVSSDPTHAPDMLKAADWLADRLRGMDFDQVAVMPTEGHPVVYGEHVHAGPDAPTILFYGHYDVQPPDPLDLWTTPPFEPTQRGESLFARGASDMKGQVVCHIKAIESILKTTNGKLPVNFKYMIEGEEEIGSTSLEAFIQQHQELLKCDFCLNADSGMLGPDLPAIMYSLRGMAYFEIHIQGPAQDLHSGSFGGAVQNPGNVLAKLIAGMHDDDGRITLPGFYDSVCPISDAEKADTARLPIQEEWWKAKTGAPALSGEKGYDANERTGARPTLDVNGLLCGFTGEGAKTVLPAKAMAKISMRLVPDQKPGAIKASLEQYLKENAPPTVTYELIEWAGCEASKADRDSDQMKAAQAAMKKVWDQDPCFIRQGGSVPVISVIRDILKVDALPLGFELPDDNLHAPDEKINIPTFYNGIKVFIHFLDIIADMKRG